MRRKRLAPWPQVPPQGPGQDSGFPERSALGRLGIREQCTVAPSSPLPAASLPLKKPKTKLQGEHQGPFPVERCLLTREAGPLQSGLQTSASPMPPRPPDRNREGKKQTVSFKYTKQGRCLEENAIKSQDSSSPMTATGLREKLRAVCSLQVKLLT